MWSNDHVEVKLVGSTGAHVYSIRVPTGSPHKNTFTYYTKHCTKKQNRTCIVTLHQTFSLFSHFCHLVSCIRVFTSKTWLLIFLSWCVIFTFCVQIPLVNHRPNGYNNITANTAETPAIPSFADVMWVFDDEGDSYTKTR